MGTWAREALHRQDVGEAAASVRVRATPPIKVGESLVLLPWEGVATADKVGEELTQRLGELAEPPGICKLRIEVLDGGGQAIAGLGATKTWRSYTVSQPAAAPTSTATAPRAPTTIDADWIPAELARPAVGGFQVAEALVGETVVQIPLKALFGLFMWDRLQDASRDARMGGLLTSFARENREMAEVLRRGQAGILESNDTMFALLVDTLPRAARAEADVELAEVKAGADNKQKSAAEQAIGLMGAYGGLLKNAGQAKAMTAAAAPSPSPAPKSTPTPAPSPAGESGDLLAILEQVPAEAAAVWLLNGPHKNKILALSRAIQQATDTPQP